MTFLQEAAYTNLASPLFLRLHSYAACLLWSLERHMRWYALGEAPVETVCCCVVWVIFLNSNSTPVELRRHLFNFTKAASCVFFSYTVVIISGTVWFRVFVLLELLMCQLRPKLMFFQGVALEPSVVISGVPKSRYKKGQQTIRTGRWQENSDLLSNSSNNKNKKQRMSSGYQGSDNPFVTSLGLKSVLTSLFTSIA